MLNSSKNKSYFEKIIITENGFENPVVMESNSVVTSDLRHRDVHVKSL